MKKYKITFWIGVNILLIQILFTIIGTMMSDYNWFCDTWPIEFLLPGTLMIIVGAIGVCSYHRSDDTKHIDKDE